MAEEYKYQVILLGNIEADTYTVVEASNFLYEKFDRLPSSFKALMALIIGRQATYEELSEIDVFIKTKAECHRFYNFQLDQNHYFNWLGVKRIDDAQVLVYLGQNDTSSEELLRLRQENEERLRQLQEAHKQLRESISRQNFYINAIIGDSFGIIEYDATADLLLDIDYEDIPEKEDFMKSVNYTLPMRASRYFSLWAETVVDQDKETFLYQHSYENLRHLYNQGYYTLRYDYLAHNTRHEILYIHQTSIFSENEAGHLIVLVILKNITHRYQEKQRNIMNLEILKALSSNYESIFFVDSHYQFEIVRASDRLSPFFQDVFADVTDFREFLQLYAEHIVEEDDRADFLSFSMPVIIAEKSQNGAPTIKVRYRTMQVATYEYFELKAVNVGTNDNPLFVYGTGSVDVDMRETLRQKKLTEEALQQAQMANIAKNRFLLDMSHDIRTPLNAIVGFGQIAQNHLEEPERLNECLDNILTSSHHLLSLVNDILDRNRIETGRIDLNEVPCHLSDAIQEVIVILKPGMQKKNITFTLEKHTVHDNIYLDTIRFKQIFQNIIGNAVKYGRMNGKIAMSIKEMPRQDEYGNFEFLIEDNGIGISKDFIDHIFEPFAREANTTTSGVSGSGLGMSITRSLINMMGGTIAIDSVQDVGTKVKVNIDLRIEKVNVSSSPGKSTMPDDTSVLAGKSVLLCEDNDLNAEMTQLILSEIGMNCMRVNNGRKAVATVRAAKQGDFDVILMDMQMPIMDGYEAVRAIRHMPGWPSEIPIFALSADAFDESKRRAFDYRMDEYITKPIDVPRLVRLLLGWLS